MKIIKNKYMFILVAVVFSVLLILASKSAIDVKAVSAVAQKSTDIISQKSSKQDEINYWIVATATLFVINALMILVLIKILKWRKTVSNGMISVVPSELVSEVKIMTGSQEKIIQWMQANVGEIHKQLKNNYESIVILKKELIAKDDEIQSLRTDYLRTEKDKIILKIVRLHGFFITLARQIENKEISTSQAINFLSEEISELFEEFEVEIINPEKHSLVKNIINDGYVIKDINTTDSVALDMTVNRVVDLGYFNKSPDGKSKVIKPAHIVINKIGA